MEQQEDATQNPAENAAIVETTTPILRGAGFRYQCHKTVVAFEIGAINFNGGAGGALLVSPDHEHGVEVNGDYMRKHKPEVGGYFVSDEYDGYASYSPKGSFEQGYTLIDEDNGDSDSPAI